MLESELFIESIEVVLGRHTMVDSVKSRCNYRYKTAIERIRQSFGLPYCRNGRWEEKSKNPYRTIDDLGDSFRTTIRNNHLRNKFEKELEKAESLWSNPKSRATIIRSYFKFMSTKVSRDLWDDYRHERVQRTRVRTIATEKNWGPEHLRYHDSLSRAQSTMLIQCRTGGIGLNRHLYSIKVCYLWFHGRLSA